MTENGVLLWAPENLEASLLLNNVGNSPIQDGTRECRGFQLYPQCDTEWDHDTQENQGARWRIVKQSKAISLERKDSGETYHQKTISCQIKRVQYFPYCVKRQDQK